MFRLRLMGLCAFTNALLTGMAANAAVISYLPAGVMTTPKLQDVATFDDQMQTAYGLTTSAGSFKQNQMTFSGTGLIMKNGSDGNSSSLGMYAEPYHDYSNYLAIMAGKSEKIDFGGKRTAFGLYWGSIDTYNYLEFLNLGKVVAQYSGADVAPAAPMSYGDQRSDGANRYVIFSQLPQFDTVVLSSGGNSFEVDNIASSIPETPVWTMMLLGFAGLAIIAFGRKGAVVEARDEGPEGERSDLTFCR